MELDGKTIVVTGSASGIGAEAAKVIRDQGARVVGMDISQKTDNVDEFVHLNLLDADSIDAAADALPDQVHGLCNIAGVPPSAGRDRVIKINYFGLRRLTEKTIDRLSDGGSIVNAASIAAFGWLANMDRVKAGLALDPDSGLEDIETFCEANGIDDADSYKFSKELVVAWTRVVSSRVKDRNIRINTVSPGAVETPILQDFLDAFGESSVKNIERVGRAGTPADIGPVIAFLCSDAAAWINGANIPVDGGLEALMFGDVHEFN